MAIEHEDIRSIIRSLTLDPPASFENLLILGDSQIYATCSQVDKIASENKYPLIAHHSKEMSALEFGKILRFKNTATLDINGKATITLDLTQPIPIEYLSKFDYIIDAGVLFYCFDPGVVLKNLFKMLRPHGTIAHITAVSGFYGRGYYNVHPIVLTEFYQTNGYKLLATNFRTRPFSSRYLRLLVAALRKLTPTKSDPLVDFRQNERIESCIYFKGTWLSKVIFSDVAHVREPRSIPNNIVGTLIYKKGLDGDLVNPVLAL
jgi:hypothetical protein